jgi:hypothetical protein
MTTFKRYFEQQWNLVECVPVAKGGDEPDPVTELKAGLQDAMRRGTWHPDDGYRAACRALGEAEGGRPFNQVHEAVDELVAEGATATATDQKCEPSPPCPGDIGYSSNGSRLRRAYLRPASAPVVSDERPCPLTAADLRTLTGFALIGMVGSFLIGLGI